MGRLIFLGLMLVSQLSWAAGWVLDNDASTLNFLSTKNGSKTEVHTFGKLQGSLSGFDGKGELKIDLSSVDTKIAIRNERMQKLFFEVDKFPTAVINLRISTEIYAAIGLGAGEIITTPATATVDLHGVKKQIKTNLRIVVLSGGNLLVTTVEPIIVSVADFDLAQGLVMLQEIAKLKSIDTSVPVTLSLVFDKK